MTLPDPWPVLFVVPLSKITRYLLDVSSADGAAKAVYLMSYGFDPALPLELERALVGHARPDLFSHTTESPFGTKFVFDGDMPSPNKRVATVRSVWQVENGSAEARLITAVPSGR